jgi:AcrR family transcriptional regulator
MTQAPGRRERKKQATREALSAAALQLALQQGVQNVRVEDIADAAGVAPRTYNNYFASREQAIVAAIAAERALRVGAALRARPEEEPLADAVVTAVVEQYTDGPDPSTLALLTGNARVRAEYLDALADLEHPLAAAIADRTDLDGDTATVLAAMVSAATRVAVRRWLATAATTDGLVVVGPEPLDRFLRAALRPTAPALAAVQPGS